MSAVVGAAEPGLVAIEWPKADIGLDFLRVEAHAALVTGAEAEARRLGLRPARSSSCQVYTVQRREGPALRFVWRAES